MGVETTPHARASVACARVSSMLCDAVTARCSGVCLRPPEPVARERACEFGAVWCRHCAVLRASFVTWAFTRGTSRIAQLATATTPRSSHLA